MVDLADPELRNAIIWSPKLLVLDWLFMLLAMMPPLISGPISHMRRSVKAGYRPLALSSFSAGYVLIWMLAGLALMPLVIFSMLMLPANVSTFVIFGLAVLWSVSPTAQRFRNLCHRFTRIGIGPRAIIGDGLRQGVITGAACVGSCWLWMLVPIAFQTGHYAMMVAVMIFLFADRIAPPRKPRWQLPPAFESFFGPALIGRRRRMF